MSNKSLKDIVSDHDKQISKSRNPLARLYRTLLLDKGVNHNTIDHYLNLYLDDPKHNVPRNSKDRSSERGNLLKQLGSASITWNTFTKGLRLLRPKNVRLILEFTDQRDEVTFHHVDLAGFEDPEEYLLDDDEDEEE